MCPQKLIEINGPEWHLPSKRRHVLRERNVLPPLELYIGVEKALEAAGLSGTDKNLQNPEDNDHDTADADIT
jgi:hypothetical protein